MSTNRVAFMGDEFYSGGFAIPEGDYALEFFVKMSSPKEGSGNASRLGVEIKAHDLNDTEHQGEKAYSEFLSMGSKANLSFAPDADTGKGLVPIAGAAGMTLNDKTNWNIFRKSLYNCGLPNGLVTDDLTPLDGIHVHLGREAEPEERKGFARATTGEAAMAGQENRSPKTIPVVTEIKEDGKPWEGTGGLPGAEEKPKGKVPAKVGSKVPAKPAPKLVAKAPAKPVAPETDETDVQTAAVNAISEVLEKKPGGCPLLALKTTVFSSIKKENEEMAQAVLDTYFQSDDAAKGLLEQLSYTLNGRQVVPMES